MRMRRKRNLDAFVEMYPDILYIPRVEELNVQKAIEQKDYLDFEKIFGRQKDIELEIGCGKGSFITELAKRHPEKSFIAVEVSKNVIVEACKKVREAGVKNVYFINCPAELLPRFLPEGSVSGIYLNFSCPYPKEPYRIRRLTYHRFLESYKAYLKRGGEIYQKTDNMHFFEFSLEQYSQCGFTLSQISLDLHNSKFEGNIVTEYEKRFSDMGMPIYRVVAKLN